MNQSKTINSLWQYIAPYKMQVIYSFLAIMVVSISILAIGKELENLIDQGFIQANQKILANSLIKLSGITIILVIAMFMRFLCVKYLGEKIIADIRINAYAHIINLSPKFFEKHHSSKIISRFTNDAAVLQNIISTTLPIAIRNFILLCGGIIILLLISVKLFLYTLSIIPIAITIIVLFGKKIKKISKVTQGKIADVSERISETIIGISTIQVFNQEKKEQEKFVKAVNLALKTALKTEMMRTLLFSLTVAVTLNGIIFVLWIGGQEILSGMATKGQLSSFVFYAVIITSAGGSLIEKVSAIYQAIGAAERLLGLMMYKNDIVNYTPIASLPSKKNITIKNITFFYHPKELILEDFSLEINQGETIALVGPSGTGKTTLIKLLLRFYDPQQGNIMLDNKDIRFISVKKLRSAYALVAQDSMIFSATVKDNISYSKPNANYKEIENAAAAAAALEFIEELPEKFETYIGENGIRLSTGQKQRIVIARAILKAPEILLLDEATSCLDAENENFVQQSISSLMHQSTKIIISHRLATIKNADRIVVINNGKIEAIGNHKNLILESTTYAKLNKLQFKK